MSELAFSIDKAFWLLSLTLFIASLFVKLDISARIAIAIWLIGNLFMDLITPGILSLSSNKGSDGLAIWYGTWSAIGIICVWCIYRIHSLYRLRTGNVARYIMACFLLLCFLQIGRYTDRVIFETNMLADIYKFGVIAINISVIPITLIWLLNGLTANRKTTTKRGAI